MTKINRISIHGFKSFAHKTEIPFDHRFNAILGPNGAGKSNLGDALCFVLGRLSAKSMRAEKASNLVFNGAKDKKPATNATVEITFDNSGRIFPLDAPEVTISRSIALGRKAGRRVKGGKEGMGAETGNEEGAGNENKGTGSESGSAGSGSKGAGGDSSSTYRINGKKHTRTEVLDLLGAARINPDGYNIVLQGDITRFVDMPPLERRRVIEEISDVTVYEEKKHKALLELQKVEEKLQNAEIILKERSVYLKELRKDRDQALKFRELREKIDSSKATLLHLQMQDKEELRGKYEKDLQQYQGRITKAEAEIASLRKSIEENRKTISEINARIERQGEKEQVQVHRNIEDLKVALAEHKTRISSLKDEISKIQQRKDSFRQEMEELTEKNASFSGRQKEIQQQLRQKEKELQQLEQSVLQFRKKHKIESSQELEQEMVEKDALAEKLQEDIQKMRLEQQDLLREKDKLEYQLQSLDERIQKVKQVEQESQQQLRQLQQKKNEFKSATLKLNQCLEQDSSFAAQLGNARKTLQEFQEKAMQLEASRSRVQAGARSNQAVAFILENRKKFKGVHGTIAELGKVPSKYSLALEVAAGGKLQHIVVDTDAEAAECIKSLQRQKIGSASFIPLNKIRTDARKIEEKGSKEGREFLKRPGVQGYALDLISFPPAMKKAFEHVFGSTLVVDTIDTARGIGIGKLKMASLDGNVAELSGVMKGGYVQRRAGVGAGFADAGAEEELEKLRQEMDGREKLLQSLVVRRESNEKEITALRTIKAELEAQIITLERSLHLEDADLNATTELKKELQEKLRQADAQLADAQKKLSARNGELAKLKTEKQQLRETVSELRNPRLLAQLNAFQESMQRCREDKVRLEQELKSSVQQLQQLIGPEAEKITEILKQHEKEGAAFTAEIKMLQESIAAKEKDLKLKENESTEFYAKYRQAFAQRDKHSAEVSKAESSIERTREGMRTAEREMNLLSLKNAEVKAKLAGLQEEFSRYKGAALLKETNAQQLQQEVNRFEKLMVEMSAVNMKALEVYEQVEQEYNKLVVKKDGLGKEKTEVLGLMNEIETKKKDHFMKTFDQVNENFQRIFGSLFSKGKAYLQLDNPKNPFEDGLSVKVKLTGSRFLDIKSLSGGEKTLTALSFIFSIQEYQPSSFYVLDEVDAALDKQNSELLSQLVRSYADRAQYILISHNDAVISEADTLFGVSMNEGVSKVTSLKV